MGDQKCLVIVLVLSFYNEKFSENHLLIIGTNNVYKNNGVKKYYNSLSLYDNELNILELKYGIELDLKTNFIYNCYLKAISNYKSDELIDIAKELNIDLMKNGKKKIKKELYDEINLLKL